MNPLYNVLLGGSIGCIAVFLGLLKLAMPANPWHRRIGRLTAAGSIPLLAAMVSRTFAYQAALPVPSLVHMAVGCCAFLFLIGKILVSWRKIPFPGWLRPLGYLLFLTFPLAGLGKTLPFLKRVQSSLSRQVPVRIGSGGITEAEATEILEAVRQSGGK